MFEGFHNLILKYDLNPFKTKVVTFEFGINLEVEEPNDLIENIITFKGKVPSCCVYTNNGFYKYFKLFGYYTLKFYNKGAHCKVNKNILRIELRGGSSRFLRNNKIDILGDLLKEDGVQSLHNFLIRQLSLIIMWSSKINYSAGSLSDQKLLNIFQKAEAWKDFKKKKPKAIYRKRKRIQGLIEQYSGYSPINDLIEKYNQKIDELWLTELERNAYRIRYKMLLEKFHKYNTI